jgi:hypothetical protein
MDMVQHHEHAGIGHHQSSAPMPRRGDKPLGDASRKDVEGVMVPRHRVLPIPPNPVKVTNRDSDILDKASEPVAALLAPVAAAEGPALVHCAAGKDRTGIVVAALLLAAGVEPDSVVADSGRSRDGM